MSGRGNHNKSSGSTGKSLGYHRSDKLGQMKFTFNPQKPKTGRTKIVNGKLYELHPTKGWMKQRKIT